MKRREFFKKGAKGAAAAGIIPLTGSAGALPDTPEDKNPEQWIDLFLKIAERDGTMPPAIAAQVLKLLDHQNFLIARPAYWSLAEQTLPTH